MLSSERFFHSEVSDFRLLLRRELDNDFMLHLRARHPALAIQWTFVMLITLPTRPVLASSSMNPNHI